MDILPLEVIGVDRLRRAIVRVDRLFVDRHRQRRRVQESALPDEGVRIGGVRAQQDRRRVDRAAGQDGTRCAHRNLLPGCPSDVGGEGLRFDPSHDVALAQHVHDARAVHECRVVIEGFRNRRDEHGLLGVDRATKPAVAEVQAAPHVAVNRVPRVAELLRRSLQHGVVAIGRLRPFVDVETLLHVLEVRRHLFDGAAADAHLLGPKLQRLGRGAEARRPVDRRGASDRAALQDDHAPVFGAATGTFLIEVAVGRALLHVELARGFEGPRFE